MSGLGGGKAQLGFHSWIGVGEEATYGTLTAGETVSSYMEFYTESLKTNIESIFLESINMSRDSMRFLQGNEAVGGSVECDLNVDEDAQCLIIKQAMGGTCSSVSATATQVTHTFALGDMENNDGSVSASDVKALTFTVKKGAATTSMFHFWGCRINTLTFSGEVGSPVKMSAEIIGKIETATAESHTVTFTDARVMHFTGISISTGNQISSLSTTACIGFEVVLNNNLQADNSSRELGNRNLRVCPPSTREVTCKLTMRYDTTTAYDFYKEGTATAIQIEMTSLDTAGSTAGNTTYSMIIKLPYCFLESNPLPEIGEKGIITQELEFRCLKANTTSGYSIGITAINDTAGY